MVNRVLIRIKVVQMLYCYLLSQSDFKVAMAPEAGASKDNRYAYQLYITLLRTMMQMAGQRGAQPLLPALGRGKMAAALYRVEPLKQALLAGEDTKNRFEPLLPGLAEQIKQLPAYKSYIRKKDPGLADDVELWLSIIDNLVEKSKDFMGAARSNPDFTYTGFHRGVMMVDDMLRSYGDNRALYDQSRRALDASLAKAHELYVSLLQLPVVLTRAQEQRHQDARNKYLPTDADLHPDLRLVENKFVAALAANPSMQRALEQPHIDWSAKHTAVEAMLDQVLASDAYKAYMAQADEPGWEQDCEVWRDLMRDVLLPGDELAEVLEGQSVYWNDDLHIVGDFVMKTVKRMAASKNHGADVELLPQFKDKDDRDFGPQLFAAVAGHYDEYRDIVGGFINAKTWSTDRLAFMDAVIMVAAVAEMLNFPSIPVGVTVNEYVEIANAYSTPGSGSFVNGVLRSVANKLREDGKLNK